jgi:hypothetical protein
MRHRKTIPILLALLLALPVAAAPAAGAQGDDWFVPPRTVGEDEEGDWGATVDSNLAPLGHLLGQDLVEAQIGMQDRDTINFIIRVSALPPWGGIPEFSRYNWDITVDGEAFQLTGAFTEYLRGVCNPLHTDSCPPPQDPGMAPFFVRQGACTVGDECHVLAIANAEFDPAEGTINIPVEREVLGAKRRSRIGFGASFFGGTIYAAPAAIVVGAAAPHDTLQVTRVFRLPRRL